MPESKVGNDPMWWGNQRRPVHVSLFCSAVPGLEDVKKRELRKQGKGAVDTLEMILPSVCMCFTQVTVTDEL